MRAAAADPLNPTGAELPAASAAGFTPYIDEHGFDPSEFKWIPVRRQRMHRDGNQVGRRVRQNAAC